jgi:hypothetical protein
MKRPTPSGQAILVGAVVLVAAAAGTAFARPSATAAPITAAQAKKIAKSIADAEITRLAPRLSVKHARTASVADSALAPALYARVTRAGAVLPESSGITQANVIHPSAGVYCFVGLDPVPKGGVAVLDALPPGVSDEDLVQVGIGTYARCPAGSQALVGAFHKDTRLADDQFFVVF